MANGLEKIEQLQSEIIGILPNFQHLQESDIRRKHIELLYSQTTVSLLNLKINIRFDELNPQEFLVFFDNDQNQAENYIHNLVQNINESIIETAIFQTELVLRYLYSVHVGQDVGEEKNFYKIISTMYSDTENNWQKEDCKLIILVWTLRNTIHTGGIYFQKKEGLNLTYKGVDYNFEYGKAPEFLKEGHFIELISDLIHSINYAFTNDPIKSIQHYPHPAYLALGHNP